MIAPNIKEMQREGQILMELPGVKEPERVYKLIQTSAKLEFYATYDARNLQSAFMALSSEYASGKGNVATAPVKEETAPDVDAAPGLRLLNQRLQPLLKMLRQRLLRLLLPANRWQR